MTDDDVQPNRIESFALSLIFALISVSLLAMIGIATRSGPADAGWWTRPWLAPVVALSLLALTNLITLWREIADLRANPPSAEEHTAARTKFRSWLHPVEFLVYFVVYVWVVRHVGYFPATLAFVWGLMLRAGLRSARWFLIGFLAVLGLVLVFRIGLGVWMPAPEFYNAFPESIRNMLIRYF